MSKITEERMREILNEIHVENTSLVESTYLSISKCFISHPEIKSLFEKEPTLRFYYSKRQSNIKHEPFFKKDKRPKVYFKGMEYTECIGINRSETSNFSDAVFLGIGNNLDISLTKEPQSSCKELLENSIGEGYEVVRSKTICYRDTDIGTGIKVAGIDCREECKTNGLKNFVGYEADRKSIRCAFGVNSGGE